jgi:SRSO17 transposase
MMNNTSCDGAASTVGKFCLRTLQLSEVRPLRFEEVSCTKEGQEWDRLVRDNHYLGYQRLVGKHLKYLVYSSRGELLAATGWSSSVWKLKSRDLAIGWTVLERQRYLGSVANNSRFVIFPWAKCFHLASHLLARQICFVRRDWERKYGIRLELLETFVDPSRFRGTSYRAANWIFVGRTRGYAKTRNGFEYHGQIKEVYLYPLSQDISKAFGLQHRPEIAVNHQYPKTLAQIEERRAKMVMKKAGWNTKVAPSFTMESEDMSELVKMFGEYYVLFRDCFGRVEHEELSRSYMQGLLSQLERKSMEPMALSLLNESRVKALQKFMGVGVWDAEKLGRRHREEAAKTVSESGGVFSVDGSDFPKKGTESVGVARQYCGRLGKVDNCQAGVFVAYASSKGHVLLDRRLFLPEQWFDEEHQERWEKCRIPEETTFKTKPELALEMIQGLCREGLFDARWVTGDDFFGRNPTFRDGLPKDLLYLLDVPCDTGVWKQRPEIHTPLSKTGRPLKKDCLKKGEPKAIPVSDLARDPSMPWKTVDVGEGAKGMIRAQFARIRVVVSRDGLPGEDAWLFFRKSLHDGEVKYALSNAPEDIPFQEMIRVSTMRWPIEQCFQEGKGEIGMDHYEHRSWDAWHRHMTFVFLAQLFLLRIRHHFKKKSGVDLATSSTPDEGCPSLADIQEKIRPRYPAVLSETKLDREMLSREITTPSV